MATASSRIPPGTIKNFSILPLPILISGKSIRGKSGVPHPQGAPLADRVADLLQVTCCKIISEGRAAKELAAEVRRREREVQHPFRHSAPFQDTYTFVRARSWLRFSSF